MGNIIIVKSDVLDSTTITITKKSNYYFIQGPKFLDLVIK